MILPQLRKIREKTNDLMKKQGFKNYEISNYAQPDFECRHNLAYWQGTDYIGVGAGAHSRVYFKDQKQRQAIMMTHQPQNWLERVQKKGAGLQQQLAIDNLELLEELILSSLRTNNGLTNEIIAKHFANKKISDLIDLKKICLLQEKGIISSTANAIVVNQASKVLVNQVIARICNSIIF